MLWIILAVVAAIAAFAFYRSRISTQHLQQLGLGFVRIQRGAFENIKDETHGSSPAGLLADSQRLLQTQYFKTVQGFGLAYTIDYAREKSRYVHHLSGKSPGKPAQFVAENMLLIMGMLLTQLKEANIETGGLFAVEQSDLGTQHLEFELTAQQQQALRALVIRASESRRGG